MLKVTLIVVSGKPEGKVIPLTAPVFRVGRDESCHLRPNSVEVSRKHTEITISDTAVVVTDLGSRNGTMVNGTLLTAPHRLKSGELLKIGPLTFAVSIQETEASSATINGAGAPARKFGALGAAPTGQIESWLVADNARPTPDRPSGVYDGDTLTIDAYTGSSGQAPVQPAPPASAGSSPASDPAATNVSPADEGIRPLLDDDSAEFERLEEGAGDGEEATGDTDTDSGSESAEAEADEYLDESNPFYIAKKPKPSEDAAKKGYSDTSDAAHDILKRMIDRRRASRS